MRCVYMSEEVERQEFAQKAAANFAANPTHSTFGDIEPDTWFAVRWGLHDRAVLVFKIGQDAPIVYSDLIERTDP